MFNSMVVLSSLVSSFALAAVEPPRGVPAKPDVSQCDNCDVFPQSLLAVEGKDLLDLASLPAERRLDFLVGEWELIMPADIPEQGVHYTVDQPVGYEIIDWFVEGRVLHAYQEWPFTSKGGFPFRARSDFRYVADEDRWQMTWLTSGASAIYSGGLEPGGVIAFYEHLITGTRRKVRFKEGMRYVFRNITQSRFIAESYFSGDGGKTFDILKWRVLYRRRTPE